MNWIPDFLGHLHPVVVHFPIGIILLLVFLEFWNAFVRPITIEGIRGILIGIAILAAISSALFGFLLERTGVYSGELVNWHRWAGVATAILVCLAGLFYRRHRRNGAPNTLRFYQGTLFLCAIGVALAGHFGGALTHGRDYISGTLPWNRPDVSANLAQFASLQEGAEATEDQLRELNVGVRAIFAHNCYRCHSADKIKGELRLDEREFVFAGGESGPVIMPGNVNESELYRRITLPHGHEDAMPSEEEALLPQEITMIRLWIEQGAYWPEGEELKAFYEAPIEPRRPGIPQRAGHSNPIDQFVDAYFESNDVSWPEPIDDRQFMRRLYLDVIGILPDPMDLQAFVELSDPNKRAVLVNETLNRSDDYAQHWLSFWNDLLRNDYSGPGYIDGGRRQITPWLYAALENNMPYDDMVRQLIAPNEDSEGFIKGIKWRGSINASQVPSMQAAQNVSQVFLGLNLKCASCHDSFVNNLKLDDAYAFAGVFADSVLEVHRCDVPLGRSVEPGFLYESLGAIEGNLTRQERLEVLAEIMLDEQNGRLRRTFVNRIWKLFMGRGFVEPVDEMDRKPWSQDALDWLASEFVVQEHNIKELMALILTSRIYQSEAVSVEDPEALKSESFVFRGPLVRRLSAEQFADALGSSLAPLYASVAYDPFPKEEALNARWIWHPDIKQSQNAYPGTRYLRKDFDIPQINDIALAEALVTADDHFTLHINGQQVASDGNWRKVTKVNLKEVLVSGVNNISVEAKNGGILPNAAGLLFSLKVEDTTGNTWFIESDNTWKTVDSLITGWNEPGFDDGSWNNAQQKGSAGWGNLVEFHHVERPKQLNFARASLVQNDDFLKALGRESRENVITSRTSQATLLQALELTNGEFLYNALAESAYQLQSSYDSKSQELVRDLYSVLLGREPQEGELQIALSALGETPSVEAIQDLLWAIILQPEFQLIT